MTTGAAGPFPFAWVDGWIRLFEQGHVDLHLLGLAKKIEQYVDPLPGRQRPHKDGVQSLQRTRFEAYRVARAQVVGG